MEVGRHVKSYLCRSASSRACCCFRWCDPPRSWTPLKTSPFEERYRRKSTLITAQLPVAQWHDMIGEPTIADAILDRIIHNAHRITLEGDSMRRQKTPSYLTSAENGEINRS